MSIPSFIYGPFWSSVSTGLWLKRSFSLLTPYFSDTSKHASSPPLFARPGCPRTYLHCRDRLSPLAAHVESRAKARWGCPILVCAVCSHSAGSAATTAPHSARVRRPHQGLCVVSHCEHQHQWLGSLTSALSSSTSVSLGLLKYFLVSDKAVTFLDFFFRDISH